MRGGLIQHLLSIGQAVSVYSEETVSRLSGKVDGTKRITFYE